MPRSWNELTSGARERWQGSIERAREYVSKLREHKTTVCYRTGPDAGKPILKKDGTPIVRTAGSIPKVDNEVAYARAQKLKSEGFLHFEVKFLIFHDIDAGSMKAMREERKAAYEKAKVTFNSWNDWQRYVSGLYDPRDKRKKKHLFADGKKNPFSLADSFGKKKRRVTPDAEKTTIPKKDRNFVESARLTREKPSYSKPRKISPETTEYLARMTAERAAIFERMQEQKRQGR